MKRDEAIEMIRLRTGQDAIPGWDERIRLEMEMAQTSLEWDTVLPWFLLTVDDTLHVTANTSSLSLPTGFLRFGSQGGLYRYDATSDDPWIPMQREAYDALKARNLGCGTPEWFAILGNTIHLFPTPAAATSFRMIFFKSAGSLATNTATNPWLVYAPELIIHLACARVDPDRSGLWMGLANTEKAGMSMNEDQRHADGILLQIVAE
ncbi:MAG: hypothetical protein HQL77_13850 [Magnetococcales bacterium]|nr:hypothetical protein [Magnetococcales bacterium]